MVGLLGALFIRLKLRFDKMRKKSFLARSAHLSCRGHRAQPFRRPYRPARPQSSALNAVDSLAHPSRLCERAGALHTHAHTHTHTHTHRYPISEVAVVSLVTAMINYLFVYLRGSATELLAALYRCANSVLYCRHSSLSPSLVGTHFAASRPPYCGDKHPCHGY